MECWGGEIWRLKGRSERIKTDMRVLGVSVFRSTFTECSLLCAYGVFVCVGIPASVYIMKFLTYNEGWEVARHF